MNYLFGTTIPNGYRQIITEDSQAKGINLGIIVNQIPVVEFIYWIYPREDENKFTKFQFKTGIETSKEAGKIYELNGWQSWNIPYFWFDECYQWNSFIGVKSHGIMITKNMNKADEKKRCQEMIKIEFEKYMQDRMQTYRRMYESIKV